MGTCVSGGCGRGVLRMTVTARIVVSVSWCSHPYFFSLVPFISPSCSRVGEMSLVRLSHSLEWDEMFKTILFIFIFFIYTHIFTIYVLFKENNIINNFPYRMPPFDGSSGKTVPRRTNRLPLWYCQGILYHILDCRTIKLGYFYMG